MPWPTPSTSAHARLVTAFAFKLIAAGAVRHADVPDRPFIESERRHILFGAAIGLPTFFVDSETENAFLERIVKRTRNRRSSGRYPGRVRVHHHEHRLTLLETLEDEAADLVDAMGLRETLRDLRKRLADPEARAGALLTRGALEEIGARNAFRVRAEDFNLASARFYSGKLRLRQLAEALDRLEEDMRALGRSMRPRQTEALASLLDGRDALQYLSRVREDLLSERLPAAEIRTLIGLTVLLETVDSEHGK